MFCCLGSKKRNYSPENGAVSDSPNHSVGDKSLRNGSVSISAPIPFVDEDVNTEEHVYVNSSIDELTKLCAKQVRDNNNYQVNTACTDSETTDTHLAHGGASETGTEESVTEELREAQQQVVLALAEADTMSQDLLMNAVSRLENVATRLESLARSQPASRTSSSSAGDSGKCQHGAHQNGDHLKF